MLNAIILLIEMAIILLALLLNVKLYGKFGLITYFSIVALTINTTYISAINLFGIDILPFTIIYALSFVVLNMLSEYYGTNFPRKAVLVSFGANVIYLIIKHLTLWGTSEISGNPIKIDILLMLIFFTTNILHTFIYDRIELKTQGKHMKLCYIVSPIMCGLIGMLAFMFVIFGGAYSIKSFLISFAISSIIEIITIICGLPIMRFGKNMLRKTIFKNFKNLI